MELVESLGLSKEDERNPRGGCHVKCATLQLNRQVSYNTTGALSGHTWQWDVQSWPVGFRKVLCIRATTRPAFQ